MACAKPPEPGRATPPSDGIYFELRQAEERVAHALSMIAAGDLYKDLERAIIAIENCIDRLIATGASKADVHRLQGQLETIKGEGMAALRHEAQFGRAQKTPGRGAVAESTVVEVAKNGLTEKSANRAIDVLTKPGHWAHETFKTALIKVIEGAGKIPAEYKETLARDTAMLLRVCPAAGGLVAAMLTRGQPQGSFMRRLGTDSNDAVGAAYEIMGMAALCRKPSSAANKSHRAPALYIDPLRDRPVFGPKAFMNHRYDDTGKVTDRKRATVEADVQIARKEADGSIREIGIDFKHVKSARTKGSSEDLLRQIEAVRDLISSGVYHEFHFVSNGKFSPKVIRAIDDANSQLLRREQREIREAVRDATFSREHASGDGIAKISVHQYVSSIQDDPLIDGEVS